ncbi:MAG TPA: CADD family putative folate metabolism protein [Thermoanaerobaculia bacterium]|nr:CADD family putative folate metabolism protein [Thermoanaerobaculia bacterium]
MSTQTVLAALDQRIRERSILNHPFYQAWTAGTLTADQLARYAEAYYPHVAAFPGYLARAIEGAADGRVRAELADNLREETSSPKAHPELWLDFAAACGLDRAAVAAAPALASTGTTVATFQGLAAAGTGSALAALYAYESQQPEVAALKAEGLADHYGVTSAEGLAYFTVHAEADVRHREGERQALAHCLDNGTSGDEVLAAADQALDAYWGLLDGICRETGIPLQSC